MTPSTEHYLLALDVGGRRIGVATCDAMGITTRGIGVLDGRDLPKAFRELDRFIAEHRATTIVVGMPYTLSGGISEQTRKVMDFVTALNAHVKEHHAGALEVVTWDERLTSAEAEGMMLEANMSRRKRKKKIDGLAAALILRGYLDGQP